MYWKGQKSYRPQKVKNTLIKTAVQVAAKKGRYIFGTKSMQYINQPCVCLCVCVFACVRARALVHPSINSPSWVLRLKKRRSLSLFRTCFPPTTNRSRSSTRDSSKRWSSVWHSGQYCCLLLWTQRRKVENNNTFKSILCLILINNLASTYKIIIHIFYVGLYI